MAERRLRLVQRLTGVCLILLSSASLTFAQGGGACKALPGSCQGTFQVIWTNPPVAGLLCLQNCPGQACAYATDPGGNVYCVCPAHQDANQDGFIDSVLCNVGWQAEPGGGFVTQCVTVIGCPAGTQCMQHVVGPGGGPPATTYVQCCCK